MSIRQFAGMDPDKQLFNLEHMKAPWYAIERLIRLYASYSDCYYRREEKERDR